MISSQQEKANELDRWQFTLIGDVVLDAQTGFANGQRSESGMLQLRMNNITTDGHVLLDSFLKVPIPQDINKYLLKSGDILFNNTNSVDLIGKTALFKNECKNCSFSNHITRIRVDENKIVPEWLLSHLVKLRQSGYFSQICARHVGQAGIRNDQVLKIQIPLPPLPEQRRIATILTTADDAIQRSRQAAAETERLKAGVMQELMTKGIGHTEFRENLDLGKVPKEWDVKPLDELIEIVDCRHHTPTYIESGYPIVRPQNIKMDGIDFSNCAYISRQEFQLMTERHTPKKGDIVYSRNASFGIPAFVETDREFCIGQDMVVMTKLTADTKFIFFVLCSRNIQIQLKKLSGGSTIQRINLKDIRRLLIPEPKLIEQQKIATIITSIDRKLSLQCQRTAHYEHLKQGLMNELLTGKRRVQVT